MVGVVACVSLDWLFEPLGNPFNTAATPGGWSDFSSPMNFLERLQNTISFHVDNRQFNYYVNNQDRQIQEFFGPGYPSASELPKDLDLLLVNSHYSLDGIMPLTPSIVPVGGLHIVDDKTKLPDVKSTNFSKLNFLLLNNLML